MSRATWKLIALPWERMPTGMALVSLCWCAGAALIWWLGAPLLFVAAGALWIGSLLLGLTLRTLMRPETLLLPRFRRHLAAAGGIYGGVTIGLPAVLALITGASAQVFALGIAGLLLAFAVGLSSGTGVRASLFAWVIFPLIGLLPKDMQATLQWALLHSPWVPLLGVLLAALLLEYTLRPMLVASDREADTSPMQAVADGRNPSGNTASGQPRRRGKIGKKLTVVLDATAHQTFMRALARFTRRPGAASRMHLLRTVLLPHDNLLGMAVNITVIVVFAAVYLLLFPDFRHENVGFIAAYAVLLGLSRFAAVGQGMLKMRPNLADLYLTLGPATNREFQSTMANALLWLVAVATINMLAFTVLIAIFMHAASPAELLLTTLIVGTGASFGALAAHLIGPTSRGGRLTVQMVLIAIAVAIYELVLWLMHRFGILIGGFSGLVICVPFGLGAWHTAQRIYLAQRPRFDAPLE